MHPRKDYPAHVRARLQRRLADFTYRFRPEHPSEGLEYIRIAAAAQQTIVSTGASLDIAVWNTYKGKRERYYTFLAEQASGADLILLQEFRHDPILEAAYGDLFATRDADMAVSFYTRPNQSAPTGVCTISSIRSLKTLFLLSRYYEPVTKTPKMAICTYYPIDAPDCPPERSLLVLNSHGINFRLRRPFLDQMLQFEAHLRQHQGPILLVGDFNTWEKGRVRILEAVARGLDLTHVHFPPGIKNVRGHELDRIYTRGGVVSKQQVFTNAAASDHSLLSFTFVPQ
jgi:endonuclease/exonuclease/phosphatase (EEP) superfamily protein YafD